jgi:hypothetical protein
MVMETLLVRKCTETMFLFPVTEMEVENVVKDFKSKLQDLMKYLIM